MIAPSKSLREIVPGAAKIALLVNLGIQAC